MKNVPGEGDCMLLAVALAAATSVGLGGNDALLRAISRETRAVVADVLQSPGNLYISQGRDPVPARRLLRSAARQEGLSSTAAYLELLRKEGRCGGLYGGGPELTVLANVLRRPISVYELPTNGDSKYENPVEMNGASPSAGGGGGGCDDTCRIICKGTFGDGLFEDPCASIRNAAVLSGVQPGAYSWHLHILVVDVPNGEKHACVLLPQPQKLYCK